MICRFTVAIIWQNYASPHTHAPHKIKELAYIIVSTVFFKHCNFRLDPPMFGIKTRKIPRVEF